MATPAWAFGYGIPASGWLYSYEANAGQYKAGSGAGGAFDALDGTWSHDNGSDSWAGDEIGMGSPGGVSGTGFIVRIQETGDPRDYAMPDPSNRKIYLGHNLTADGASATLLDAGATIYFRARVATGAPLDDLHPDGGAGIAPWPAGGDGYLIHDGGKGNIGLKQSAGGVISFSLATAGDTGGLATGLLTNNLNGTVVSGDVDSGEAGTPNVLPVDVTQWHDYWITIRGGGTGTHTVTVFLDGSLTPAQVFNVTAGSGSDFSGMSYLALGVGSTGQSGAIDVDFIRVAPGVQDPIEAMAVPAASVWTLGLLAMSILALGAYVLTRRRPALA